VVLEERARLGPPVHAPFEPPFVRREPAVHLPGADREQRLLEGQREAEALPGPGEPEREQCLEAHRPRAARGLPDRRQDRDELNAVGGPPSASWGGTAPRRPLQQPDGMLAMVPRDLTELVQDPCLERPGGLAVAGMDGLEVLPLGLMAHDVTLL
jgi:hypothetical protein